MGMDLREKPGILKRFGEFLLRFRLVLVFLSAVVCGIFFAGYSELLTFGLAVSETLGIRFAEGNLHLLWPWSILLVILLLLRFFMAGKFSGFSALVSSVSITLLFFALQNTDSIMLPALILFALLSLVLFVVLKHGFGCATFPAFLSFLAFVGCFTGVSLQGVNRMEVLFYAILLVADIFAVALMAGKNLSFGEPKNGAFLFGIQKQFLPTVFTAVIGVFFFALKHCALFSMDTLFSHILISLSYLLFFFFLSLPLLSFAPFSRLRASKRTMQVPKSTGVKK